MTVYAPKCFSQMVASARLTDDTPHAALPEEATAGAWVATANAEGGQLDIANSRARAITGIGKTCEDWQQEAKKEAERKPWWRRIF